MNIYLVSRHDHYDESVPLRAFTDVRLANAYHDLLEEEDSDKYPDPLHKMLRGYSWHVAPVELVDI